jgi:hypothetical protein
MHHFHPHGESRACWECEHWGGWDSSGCYAVCLYDDHVSIKQSPKDGCAMWVRATGADDADPPDNREREKSGLIDR